MREKSLIKELDELENVGVIINKEERQMDDIKIELVKEDLQWKI